MLKEKFYFIIIIIIEIQQANYSDRYTIQFARIQQQTKHSSLKSL